MKSVSPIKNKKLPPAKKVKANSFPIVAIGASAGGLEAMKVLLKNLPDDTGMAYIYVQHLSPDHKSLLAPILSKITKMKVQEIEDMEHMKPNNIYIIPHNKLIEVTDGHIQILPRLKNNPSKLTIDVLFASLAETHKENVVGVVLSGYGADGAIGIKAIKDAGGVTIAQDSTSQAGSMPKAAIDTGAIDFVLSPVEIAKELTRFSKNGFKRTHIKEKQKEPILENSNSDLNTIFELLLKETGVDFSHYKMPTIKRRLNHKMLECGVKTTKEYVKFLLKNEKEIGILYKDLLINVTSFFRDKEAFRYLKSTLLPKLLKSKTPKETLRIWVAACSSGEEAYSIAMMIIDMQDSKIKKIPVKVFATDLSEQMIRVARIGEYSEGDMKAVPKKYVDRFFTKTGDKYRIGKELREMCVFAPHNILRDPPFSRMDFVSCRNLLIYFDSAAQKKVFSTLHFALNEGGTLMLGKAETIGASSQLFTPINTKFKIYSRKKNVGVRKIPELTPRFPRTILPSINKRISAPVKHLTVNPTGIESAIDTVLLSHYMPACVVVNKDLEIIQFRGPISMFLTHPAGKASLNILKMTRPEFAFELRNAIHKAIKTKKSVHKTGIEIKIDSVFRLVSLDVSHLKVEWDEPLLLVVFTLKEQVEKYVESSKDGKNNSTLKDRRIKQLAEELNTTRAEMNSIIETQETTYEELQAANEEIVSTNEEFQTLNEELETSKEEIEATNEELISTNLELQLRNDLLTESQEYSESIVATLHEPMLVLYKDFRVKSANKSFYSKFHVKKEETEGELLFELGNKQWNILKLHKVLNEILTKNKSFENFEVTHTFPGIGEKIMLLNAHLIIQKAHSDPLILLAISDITEARRLAIELQIKETKVLQNEEKAARAAELIIANKKLAHQNKEKEKRAAELVIANKELAFQNKEKEKRAAELIIANKELVFQNTEKEKRASELVIANKELALQNKEKEKRAAELIIANKELALQNKEKGKRAAELIIANKELAFQNKEKEKRAAELIIANKELVFQNSEKAKRAAELVNANYARSLIEASPDPLVTISAKGKITDVNEASIKVTGISRKKLIGTNFSHYFTEPKKAQEGYEQVFEKGFVSDYPLTIKHKNGKLTDVLYNASLYKDDDGNVLGVFAAARDVTEQKRIEENLELSLREVSDYKYALDEFSIVAITDQKGIIKHANDNFCKISKYTRKELIGQDHRIVNSGYHSKEFMKDLWVTISGGKIWRGEIKNKAKDGTIYWVTTTIVPFLNEHGKPYQYVAVRTDITDQKRNATELTEAKIFAELATEIAEQAQSKAEKATQIAEDAVKAKQQFLSNMSHEIRTPMNAIVGFTKVVLKTDLSAKQKEYLSAIKVSGDSLIVLINDILDLAKVDAGKMTFEKTPFKMESSISSMLQLFETKIQEKNLTLVKEYDSNIPKVLMGDQVRLHQIILNLVSNAVKFTIEGKITVSLRLVEENKEKAIIEFGVSDTGIGIAENKIETIFENFQQATSDTSRLFGGTGLGLAIVKQLVEAQGGTIKVKSKMDVGSTFSFRLSFLKTNDIAEIDSEILELDGDIKNIKVLVVEDIALNQLLMKTLLDDFGFERDIASNGKIAIEKLQNKSYDIILMDLQMPEMNGFEATEYIRNTMKSKIPIIALTADVTTVDLAKCKAIGMDDYIAKPIDEKLLYSKIVGLVKKSTPVKIHPVIEIGEGEKSKYTDLNYLTQRTKSNPKLMTEMISLYLEQTPTLITVMKQSLFTKDWNTLDAASHKIIPSFSIIGMNKEFENMAKKIQEYASLLCDGTIDEFEKSKIPIKLNELVLKLETVCTQACEELTEELLNWK